MSYDTIVIGAGLAGLTAALRLTEDGQRVLVLAKGVGSTHLSGATIDVLGYTPERVDAPAAALPQFVSSNPGHPYARITAEGVARSIEWFQAQMDRYRYVGGLEQNLLLPTAIGALKPTAVVPETMAGGDLRSAQPVVLVGLRALKDFYPVLAAANLARAALDRAEPAWVGQTRGVVIDPPVGGQADVNSLGFARRFDDLQFVKEVVGLLGPLVGPGERVGLPAVLGLRDPRTSWQAIQDALGTPVFEIPTLPPSVPGIRLFTTLKDRLARGGGRVTVGSTVLGAKTSGRRVEAVIADTAPRQTAYSARWFVLASGGIGAGGIAMDSHGDVRETVFGLPVQGVPERRDERFAPGYFDPQPGSSAGLDVDDCLRPLGEDGEPAYENLHAAGATLGGAEPWREKSGDGISVASGFRAAEMILEGSR